MRTDEELLPVSGGELLVFAQSPSAWIDVAALSAHGERFFATRLGLAADRPATQALPRTDTVRFVVAPDGHPAGIRTAHGRPRNDADLALAGAAEAKSAGAGLAYLARRCETIWQVERLDEFDAIALQLCAVLASFFLGPIVDPSTFQIFGVKTARAKVATFRERA